MRNNKYNGWSNRETWLINVWFGDNWECAGDVDVTREFCESEMSEIPMWLQDFVDLEAVNWDELRKHAEAVEEEILENS